MAEKTVKLIESIRNEGYDKGFDECKMLLIRNALRKCSVDEIAELLCLSVSEVQKYVEM
ncbi:hypothetical protein [Methanobrevibacter sp.]